MGVPLGREAVVPAAAELVEPVAGAVPALLVAAAPAEDPAARVVPGAGVVQAVPVAAAAVEAQAVRAAGVQVLVAEVAAAPASAPTAGQAAALEQARAPEGARGPEVLRVQEATAVDPVRVQESAQASVSEPDPVRLWAKVSVPARTLLLAPARMHRWAPGRMLQQHQRPYPAPGSGQDSPPAMGPAMEAGIRELDLKTAQVLGPLHGVRHILQAATYGQ